MSESPKITGKIIALSNTQHFASGFQKREFVVETFEQYPQPIKVEALKAACDQLDSYKVGDTVIVSYNLRGNEYNGKYYVSVQGWKIERKDQQVPPAASSHQQAKSNAYAPDPPRRSKNQNGATLSKPVVYEDDGDDNIPF